MWSHDIPSRREEDVLERDEDYSSGQEARRRHMQRLIELQEEIDRLPTMARRGSGRRAASPTVTVRAAPQQHHQDTNRNVPSASPQEAGPSTFSRGTTVQQELRMVAPFLSSSFQCTDDDAFMLLSVLRSTQGSSSLEDRLMTCEAEKRSLEARLERKLDECEKLKDEVGEVRQKLRAVQQQATQTGALLSQKRDEVRKQLVLEEGRTQKLQHQNKLLTQELEKLKSRVHTLMK